MYCGFVTVWVRPHMLGWRVHAAAGGSKSQKQKQKQPGGPAARSQPPRCNPLPARGGWGRAAAPPPILYDIGVAIWTASLCRASAHLHLKGHSP
jgi:hypothetical protein